MLEYKMRIDFDADRWFQVEAVLIDGRYGLEFTTSPGALQVTLAERGKLLGAVAACIKAINAFEGVG